MLVDIGWFSIEDVIVGIVFDEQKTGSRYRIGESKTNPTNHQRTPF